VNLNVPLAVGVPEMCDYGLRVTPHLAILTSAPVPALGPSCPRSSARRSDHDSAHGDAAGAHSRAYARGPTPPRPPAAPEPTSEPRAPEIGPSVVTRWIDTVRFRRPDTASVTACNRHHLAPGPDGYTSRPVSTFLGGTDFYSRVPPNGTSGRSRVQRQGQHLLCRLRWLRVCHFDGEGEGSRRGRLHAGRATDETRRL